jgi:hypothetical protein
MRCMNFKTQTDTFSFNVIVLRLRKTTTSVLGWREIFQVKEF